MKLTKRELVRLNRIISVAFLSGKIEMDEISESIHHKVSEEIATGEGGERRMYELMKLRVEKKDGKNMITLDNQEIRGVLEYKIESPAQPGFAELSLKLAVKYPVEQN